MLRVVEICIHTGQRETVDAVERLTRRRVVKLTEALNALHIKGRFDTEHYWYRIQRSDEPTYSGVTCEKYN